MNVGSLFSGIGGFDIGLERAGMRIAWQAEVEPFASAVLRKHWPHVPNYGDVRAIRAGAVERVDVLCGGFPCQDISVAGNGAGIEGERSGLWREYARLVRELRPRWVCIENVPALRTRGYDRVADDLESAGYTVQAFVVGADDIGAPHRRKRVWIVAYANAGRCEQQRQPNNADKQSASWRELDGCDRARVSTNANGARLAQSEPQPGSMGEAAGGRARRATERSDIRELWQGPPVPPVCELDDGIPAGLVRHRRSALAALGNSLVPQIAEAIGRAIMRVEG